MTDADEDNRLYSVVINDEDQYSIWFADSEAPAGWRRDGITATKSECLEYIAGVWTDMRPRSVREWRGAHPEAADG